MTAAITKIIVDSTPYIATIVSTLVAYLTYREGKRKNRHDELEDMNDRLRADNDRLRRENERLRKETSKQ
ncbi:integrase [Lactobacillus phage CL2]|uniref:Integrase n=1 Tax=Lactobacillus phage CL2 TaxID=1739608 RepID=A0A0P0IZD5_9CAUD|nr:integrase [Lactobacillus phage CL2]ALJ97796.1 integrase [Lactobacillus phage CL2]